MLSSVQVVLTHCHNSIYGHESLHAPNEAVVKLGWRQAQQKQANADFDQHDTDKEERLADEIDV